MRFPVRSSKGLADQLVVLCVRPDPEPHDAVGRFHAHGAVTDSNARRVEPADFLQVKRGMSRIAFELLETAIGETLYWYRQRPIALPELRRGVMIQNFVVLPDSWAFSAVSASASSFPARTSASNWRSHASASNAANHSRSSVISSGDRSWISRSIFSTLPITSVYRTDILLTANV